MRIGEAHDIKQIVLLVLKWHDFFILERYSYPNFVKMGKQQAPKSNSDPRHNWFITEDLCESSFKLSVRFGTSWLKMFMPFLVIASFITNVILITHHKNEAIIAAPNPLNSPLQRSLESLPVLNLKANRPVDENLPKETASDDVIEQPPMPMSNTNFTEEIVVYDIRSTNRILADEKRETRNKRRAYRRAKRTFIDPKNTGSLASNASLAACLLVKDDNDILSEWIAYHYHTLNMRFLIVAVDPHSLQSPAPILAKWKLLTDLEILEWNDDMYMPPYFLKNGHAPLSYLQKSSKDMDLEGLMQISNHRYRQRVFLAKCLKASKQRHHTWTLHVDTDEFVVPSKLFRQVKPDYVSLSPIEEPGSVLNFLKQVTSSTPTLVNYPCIPLMRLLFGSVEYNQNLDSIKDSTLDQFNATEFETLRWRYHAPAVNMSYHGNPKVVIDVSAIPETSFSEDVVFSIHRPFQEFCKVNKDLDYTIYYRQPLAANHYLGSWERYSGRNDSRRSREVYESKAHVRGGVDHGIRNWLQGFRNAMGQRRTEQLLAGKYLSHVK